MADACRLTTRARWIALSIAVVTLMAATSRAVGKDSTAPFSLVRNEIVVHVSVDDVGPLTMLIDTGTDPSVIDFATAERLGLARPRNVSARRPYAVTLRRVSSSEISTRSVPAIAADLSRMSERFGARIDGVLGHSFLKGHIVEIDYPAGVLRLDPSETLGGAATVVVARLPFRYRDDILLTGVSVGGRPVVATLDTGSDGTFKFTPRATVDLGLDADVQRAAPATSEGYAGSRTTREGTLSSSIDVGGIRVDAPRATFFGPDFGTREWALNIGNAFLKAYIVRIDYGMRIVSIARPR